MPLLFTSCTPPVTLPFPSKVMLPAARYDAPAFWPDRPNAYCPFKVPLENCTVITAPLGATLLSLAVAVTLTLAPSGGVNGAVYTPVAWSKLPQPLPAWAWQFAVHVTAIGLPFTVAVNVCCPPAGTFAEEGVTTMDWLGVAGAEMVTDAAATLVVSACEVAATVTVAGDGGVFGAVYSPPVEMNPTVGVPPTTEFTVHVTTVFVLLVTEAVNCWLAPVISDADVGEIVIVTPDEFDDDPEFPPPHPDNTASNANATTTDNTTRFIDRS